MCIALFVIALLLSTQNIEALQCYDCGGGPTSPCYTLSGVIRQKSCETNLECVKQWSDNHVVRKCAHPDFCRGEMNCWSCTADLCNSATPGHALPPLALLLASVAIAQQVYLCSS